MPAASHAADEGPDPGSPVDAVDGAAPLPLGLGRDVEVLQVVVVLRPRTRPSYAVARINRHDVPCPSVAFFRLLLQSAGLSRTSDRERPSCSPELPGRRLPAGQWPPRRTGSHRAGR